MVRSPYTVSDFDFAIAYIDELEVFYVFPATIFISYGSEIHLVEAERRQRKLRSATYRERWDLIEQTTNDELRTHSLNQPAHKRT